jgi:NitT/TauT family transport system substrate-binding protein
MLGPPYYVLEQHGFRKLVDTTFMMGFLVSEDADVADVERYFTGLRRAQRDIDFEPERYKHYWLREMPDDIQRIVDVRRFGPGERIVPEPYTREMFGRAQRWMRTWDLLDPAVAARPAYDQAVLTWHRSHLAPCSPGTGLTWHRRPPRPARRRSVGAGAGAAAL